MNSAKPGKIILFPKTLDYYQIQLTKMLETEAYGEAIGLLRFLLQCKTEDERANNEWSTLLEWLITQFPDAEKLADAGGDVEEGDVGEEELLRAKVTAKTSVDRQYIGRLLDAIRHASLDKQLLALDQLAFVDDQSVGDRLLQELQSHALHPFVAFKLLQTLNKLGVQGEATFGKLGEIVTVEIERTPLELGQFPAPLPEVGERVQQYAEVNDPTLSYFAVQTWQEFLAYSYGNAVYRQAASMPEELIDVWAAALHMAVSDTMNGGHGNGGEIMDVYGITEMYVPSWERAYHALQQYFHDSRGANI